jgi:hypothetical protein
MYDTLYNITVKACNVKKDDEVHYHARLCRVIRVHTTMGGLIAITFEVVSHGFLGRQYTTTVTNTYAPTQRIGIFRSK